jgi:hypothetical protein
MHKIALIVPATVAQFGKVGHEGPGRLACTIAETSSLKDTAATQQIQGTPSAWLRRVGILRVLITLSLQGSMGISLANNTCTFLRGLSSYPNGRSSQLGQEAAHHNNGGHILHEDLPRL